MLKHAEKERGGAGVPPASAARPGTRASNVEDWLFLPQLQQRQAQLSAPGAGEHQGAAAHTVHGAGDATVAHGSAAGGSACRGAVRCALVTYAATGNMAANMDGSVAALPQQARATRERDERCSPPMAKAAGGRMLARAATGEDEEESDAMAEAKAKAKADGECVMQGGRGVVRGTGGTEAMARERARQVLRDRGDGRQGVT